VSHGSVATAARQAGREGAEARGSEVIEMIRRQGAHLKT
jgi:hypothetical protein